MSILDNILKSICTVLDNPELEALRGICKELDDQLDAHATKIYKIRKVALQYSDEYSAKGAKNLSSEVLEIIGNSPRCSNQQPN